VLFSEVHRVGKSSRFMPIALADAEYRSTAWNTHEVHLCIYNITKQAPVTKFELNINCFKVQFAHTEWTLNQVFLLFLGFNMHTPTS
jgi:hypothetical protein